MSEDRAGGPSRGKPFWRVIAWLPLVVVAGAWAASYARRGVAAWPIDDTRCYFVLSQNGRLAVSRQSITPAVPPGPYKAHVARLGQLSIESDDQGSSMMSFDTGDVHRSFLGFGTSEARGTFGMGQLTPSTYQARFTLYAVPYWALAVVAAVPPVFVIARRRRRMRRLRHGRCTQCGYDLRATPGRCPECGAEPRIPRPQPSSATAAEQ